MQCARLDVIVSDGGDERAPAIGNFFLLSRSRQALGFLFFGEPLNQQCRAAIRIGSGFSRSAAFFA